MVRKKVSTYSFEKDIKDYFEKKKPELDRKIDDMEKRAALKNLEASVEEKNVPGEGDLLFAIFTKYKIEIERIGIWGAVIFGAILILIVSSCFGGSNVEEAPIRAPTTTTLSEQTMPNIISGQAFSFALIVGAILFIPMLLLILHQGGRYAS